MIDVLFEYVKIPYLTPVPVRGVYLTENRFLKVTLLEQDFFLSALHGFHETSLEEVEFKLNIMFNVYALNFRQIDFSQKFFNIFPLDHFTENFSGELLFHVESILLGIIRTTHPDLFNNSPIKLNELYTPMHSLDYYAESSCLKIKIRPENFAHISEILTSLYQLNPTLLFRLDGNKKFELDELAIFANYLKTNLPAGAYKNIDYIEEPFKNFYDTYSFEKNFDLKIALDESFKIFMNENEITRIAVIKPSLIGLSSVWNWLRSRQENRAIISSSFEHPTVMLSLQMLAKLRPEEFHGLENFVAISK
jgi:hypothetical protein